MMYRDVVDVMPFDVQTGIRCQVHELAVSLRLIALEQSSAERDVQGFRKRDAGKIVLG